VSIKFM